MLSFQFFMMNLVSFCVSALTVCAGATRTYTPRGRESEYHGAHEYGPEPSEGETPRYNYPRVVMDPRVGPTTPAPINMLTPFIRLDATSVNGGVMEYRYNSVMLATMSQRTREMALAQIELDSSNNVSAPYLLHDGERVPLGGFLTDLKLGPLIARGYQSVVYSIVGRPGLVIKYEANCGNTQDVHPLLRDYWLQADLPDSMDHPRVHFVSPPATFGFPITRKTFYQMDFETRKSCARSGYASVRYMVMDRVGMSMYNLIDETASAGEVVPFSQAIAICQMTIQALKQLHSHGIVHGDIHPGNVAFLDKARTRIGLIDYGMAFWAEEAAGTPDRALVPRHLVKSFLSPFVLMGFRRSFRDDVYRAVEMAAMMMNPEEYIDYVETISLSDLALLKFKRDSFIFTAPDCPDPVEEVSGIRQADKTNVRTHLKRVLSLVRNVELADLPPYDAIIAELDAIQSIVH